MTSTPPSIPWLVGVWKGKGKGIYPTIKDFDYTEESTFKQNPVKPVIAYTQATWGSDGKPLHAEAGYLRILPNSKQGDTYKVELILSQPNGLASVEVGMVDLVKKELTLKSSSLARSPSARPPHVVDFTRKFWVEDANGKQVLKYWMDMTTDKTANTRHLDCELEKVIQ